MNTSLIVFVCGTQFDLADERSAVLEAIRRLQLQHDSMEYFGARSDAPIETCLQEVRRSNIITVIVGLRYGSLVPGMNVSFSEAEYSEAYRLHKTCLVYLRDENVPVLPKYFESNPENLQRLQAFKNVLGQRHTTKKFRDSNDLALQVTADLSHTVQTLEQALESQSERPGIVSESPTEEITQVVGEAIGRGVPHGKALSVVRRAMSNLLLTEGLRRPIVFLSHPLGDSELATALAHALRAEGADPWLDLEQIRLGDSITARLGLGLDAADAVVIFVSDAFGLGQNYELGFLLQRRLSGLLGPLAVAVVTGNAEIPPVLRDSVYFDLRDGDIEKAAKGIVASIQNNRG
jgi:hypothetical protein